MTTDNSADRGFTDTKLSSQVLLKLPGAMPQANVANLSLSQFGIPISTSAIRGAVPNPVGLLVGRGAVAEIGHAVVQHSGGAMPNLLSSRARPQEGRGDQKMNMMMPLGSVAISQLDLPVSAVRLGGIGRAILPHNAAWSNPGVDVSVSGFSQDSSIKRTDAPEVGDFVQSFVAINGVPSLHAIQSISNTYFKED